MAVPTQLSDLSETAASNSPAGTDTVGTTMDDYIRAHASIIARIAAGTDKIAPAGVTGTAAILGANTFTGLQIASLGLTVSGADFNSRGITDNATAKALTLSGSGANSVTIANSATNPTIGTSAGDLAFAPAGVAGRATLSANFFGINGATGSASGFVANAATGFNALYAFQVNNSEVARLSASATALGITTGSSAVTQVSVNHTASADRYITLTGSNGGNPIIGTSAGDLQLNTGGLGKALQLTSAGTPVNYVRIQSRNTGAGPILWAEGSDTNVSMEYRTQAAGSHTFLTEGATGSPQVHITHTASADRYITLTGANAANPKIATSAGSLDIGSPVVFTGQTVGTTVGATGAASALPANPLGYITTAINGTACKIPYYN